VMDDFLDIEDISPTEWEEEEERLRSSSSGVEKESRGPLGRVGKAGRGVEDERNGEGGPSSELV
jgi:hypothetical protein